MIPCPHCAEQILEDERVCRWCRTPILRGPTAAPAPSAVERMLLPVGRSVWAIVAGYLGLFSLLVCPAPLALIVSIVAMVDLRNHPEKHGWGRTIFGLIMGILGTAALVAIGIARLDK